MHRILLAIAALLIFTITSGCQKGSEKTAQKGSDKPVTVRFSTSKTWCLPFSLGVKKGYFAEQGIDVKLVEAGGVNIVIAAAAGEADMGAMGSPILIGAATGVPIKIIASPPSTENPFILVARNEYKSVAELKGKKISYGRPGNGTIQAFNFIVKANGLKLEDFQNVDAGAAATSLAALKSGQLDAIVTSEMTAFKAEEEGYGKVIARASDYFGRYQHSYIFATDKFIKEQPDVLRKFLAAFRKSVEYAKSNPEEVAQYGIKDLELEEKPLRHALKREIPKWIADGKVDLVGTNNALKILRELGELDKKGTVTAEQLVDQRFLTQ